MPDNYTSSSRNQNAIDRAYSQNAIAESQVFLQMQPWYSDEQLEILTTNDFETLYTNGYQLSGLEKVNPSEELKAQLNSINIVNQLNLREQLKKALDSWDDGPWYITGDESNLIIHNHQEDTENKDDGLVYYYDGENGEVLKVVIASKDVFGAGAVRRNNQVDYMGQQTKVGTIPTGEELKDVNWDAVSARQENLRTEKTPEELKQEEQRKYEEMYSTLGKLGWYKHNGEWRQFKGGSYGPARDASYIYRTYGEDYYHAGARVEADAARMKQEYDAYQAGIQQQVEADRQATEALQKQARVERIAARKKFDEKSIQVTPQQRYDAIKIALTEGLASNIFSEEDARAVNKYLELLEQGKITKIDQAAINDVISKYEIKAKNIQTQSQQWRSVYGDRVDPTYTTINDVHGTRAHPGSVAPVTNKFYAKGAYNKIWNFDVGSKDDIRQAKTPQEAGQAAYKTMTGADNMSSEIKALFPNIPANYDRFIKSIQSSIEAERNAHQQKGEYFKGVQIFTTGKGEFQQLHYKLVWEKLEKTADVDVMDLILGDEGIVDIVTAVGSDVKNALAKGKNNANKALNHMRRARFREIEVQMQVVGRPTLVAPGMLKIFNIGQRYSGLWYIKTCIHQIESGSGYTTSLTLIKNKATAQTKVATVRVREEKEEQVAVKSVTIENRNPDGTVVKVDISVDTLETNMAILDALNRQGDHEMAAAAQVLINNGRIIHYTDEEGNVQIDYSLLNAQKQLIEDEKKAIEDDIRAKTARVKQLSKLSKEAKEAQANLSKVKVKDPKTLKYAAETAQQQAKQVNEAIQMGQSLTSQVQQAQSQLQGLTSNFA